MRYSCNVAFFYSIAWFIFFSVSLCESVNSRAFFGSLNFQNCWKLPCFLLAQLSLNERASVLHLHTFQYSRAVWFFFTKFQHLNILKCKGGGKMDSHATNIARHNWKSFIYNSIQSNRIHISFYFGVTPD